ncbi:TPR_REGION domain-containing protein [Psidium guajava]|nr:TPR_REGION domain-containing protein [Psidium guajava]
MNSNYGKTNYPQRSSGSLNSFDFDIGIGSNKPRSLNDQRNKTTSFSYAATSSPAQPSRPAWSNKPSWTHQPAAAAPSQSAGAGSLGGPTSMVGDIFGKSWSSSSTTSSMGSGLGIGIAKKDPHLFGDLVTSALGGQGKGSSSNAPLKNATPAASASKTTYSMGNLADSLPKSGNPMNSSGSWGSGGSSTGGVAGVNWNGVNTNNKSATPGDPSMRNMAAAAATGGGGINTNKDPFSNLVGLGSKHQSGSLNSASKVSAKASTGSQELGDFQNAPTSGTATFSSSGFSANKGNVAASNMSFDSKMDYFGMPAKDFSQQNQTPAQSSGADSFDALFSSSSGSAAAAGATGGQQAVEVDDWGLDSDLGGGKESSGSTTELEGLPPPPSGVSALTAKNKGMDNQKQGQYADAIKWLSWAVILLEKAGDNSATGEVLSCRASCYKEVGEYKKAVADCTKVLEHDDANVAVLVQRALLYESMEKYRLGADDLRMVLKIDPGNRVARSTIHRLNKMAD